MNNKILLLVWFVIGVAMTASAATYTYSRSQSKMRPSQCLTQDTVVWNNTAGFFNDGDKTITYSNPNLIFNKIVMNDGYAGSVTVFDAGTTVTGAGDFSLKKAGLAQDFIFEGNMTGYSGNIGLAECPGNYAGTNLGLGGPSILQYGGMTSGGTVARGAVSGTSSKRYINNVSGTGAITANNMVLNYSTSSAYDYLKVNNSSIKLSAGLHHIGNANIEISGVISSTNVLNKSGSGFLKLSGKNTYTGNTMISGGTLDISGTGGIYTSADKSTNNSVVIKDGGVLVGDRWTKGAANSLGGLDYNLGYMAVDNGTLRNTASTDTFMGSNTAGRAIAVGVGGMTIENATVATTWTWKKFIGDVDSSFTNNAVLTLAGVGNGLFEQVVSSAGVKVTKNGTGKWTLTAANTYTGGTTVSSGTLVVANASALGTGAVTLSGGTLDLGAFRPANTLASGATGTLVAELSSILATNILMAVEAGVTQVPVGLTVQVYDASGSIRHGVPAVIGGNLVFIALTVDEAASSEIEDYIIAQVPAGMAGNLVQVVATDLRSNTVRSLADSATVAYQLNIVPVYTTDGTTISATFGYLFGPILIAMDSTMDVGIKVSVNPGTLGSAVTGSVKLMGSEKIGVDANFTEISQKVNPFYGSEGAIDFLIVEPSTNRFFKIIVE